MTASYGGVTKLMLRERGRMKLNCWEFKNCGREREGAHVDDLGVCPAAVAENLNGLHGGTNGGRACWFVVGTLCNGEVQGTYVKKYRSCIYCDFFKTVKEEEYTIPQPQEVSS
jgi:hypothetical protein